MSILNNIDTNTAMFSLQQNKLNNLNNLKNSIQTGKDTKDDSLKKASADFEAVFVKQLLEIMDSTVQKGEFMHGGQAEGTFKSMMNDELAKNISSNPHSTFGLAEQIYKQMKDLA